MMRSDARQREGFVDHATLYERTAALALLVADTDERLAATYQRVALCSPHASAHLLECVDVLKRRAVKARLAARRYAAQVPGVVSADPAPGATSLPWLHDPTSRDDRALDRDQLGGDRDAAAGVRDAAAEVRDAASHRRDRHSESLRSEFRSRVRSLRRGLESPWTEGRTQAVGDDLDWLSDFDVAASRDRAAAAQDRADAAADRQKSMSDRQAGAADREQAAIDRAQAR